MSRKLFGVPLPIIILLVALILLVLTAIIVITNFTWIQNALTFVFDANSRHADTVYCYDSPGCSVIYPIVFIALLLFIVLTAFAYTTLLERRLIAWFQARVGPNRVGPKGLLQPLADAIKLIFKEDIRPANVYNAVYLLAPILKVVPVILVIAVIPLGPDLLIPWFDGVLYQVPLAIADPNVGVLWLLAITSLATYGVVLAGWSSNNKYAMLGGLRASAQMISYELTLGLTIAVPVMLAGSMSLGEVVDAQRNIWEWFVFRNPVAAAILLIALLAEVNRAPFDLPEAEQELTQGYMTEYSGMKFAMFMMAEYIGMIAVSLIAASLFFGGYHLIPVDVVPIMAPVNLILKVFILLVGMIWIRATLPRIRYDRLMHFGWKVLLPLALVAVAWTAISVVVGDVTQGNPVVYGIVSGIVFAVVLIAGIYYLRRTGQLEDTEDDLANDPIVTGEPRGVPYALLTFVGALVAVPFVLYNFTIKQLEGMEQLGTPPQLPEPPEHDALPAGGEQSGAD